MAKVIVFTPDLLFGSSLVGALSAHGHTSVMTSNVDGLLAEASDSQCVIVDLTDEVEGRLEQVIEARAGGELDGIALLGYYSHVEPESRDAGLAAGISKVVPRSRMHREPADLVEAAIEGLTQD